MDNTSFPPSAVKRPIRPISNDGLLEALRGLGSGVGKSVAKDVTGQVGSDAFNALLGKFPRPGEMRLNRPSEFGKERSLSAARRIPERPRPPIIELDSFNVKQELQTVRAELQALVQSVKNLKQEVHKSVAETPVDPGIYHLNFFDHLRSMLKILKEQIDDSRSWLALSTTRKKQKGYWGSYQKHGTQFGLSSERTSATQSG